LVNRLPDQSFDKFPIRGDELCRVHYMIETDHKKAENRRGVNGKIRVFMGLRK